MTQVAAPIQELGWFFEAVSEREPVVRRIALKPLPFLIGRNPDLPLTLAHGNVSRVHAEVALEHGRLVLRDLQSTNGTYVNQQRVSVPVVLHPGDIVNIAHYELQLAYDPPDSLETLRQTQKYDREGRKGYLATLRDMHDLLREEAVVPVFQPILELCGQSLFGYELLGRGDMAGLPSPPKDLFAIASGAGVEAPLSCLFRKKGVEASLQLGSGLRLFVNVHPAELREPQILLDSLRGLAQAYPTTHLHVEIHEGAVTDVASMRSFQQALRQSGIALVYDDFGAGQARLLELVEVPPDFLKFDMSLIRGLNQGSSQRKQMIRMLVQLVRDAGVRSIAEGVECREEAEACTELGFFAAQGFFFARPYPAALHSEITLHEFWAEEAMTSALPE